MGFKIGDQVEICSEEEGLLGSYYAAKIIGKLGNNNNKNKKKKKTEYVVQYETLLKKDESGPLVEVVRASEVRPKPPETPTGFTLLDEVDAFDKDGWWAGKVTGRDGFERFLVYFDIWEEEVAYPSSKLRLHHDWCNDKWLSSKDGSSHLGGRF